MALNQTLKRAAAVLRDADVGFALTGSAAAWARGAPEPRHDIDFAITHEDAARAEQALARAGFRIEQPPEGWLSKAWDGDDLVDLIWEIAGCESIDTALERAEEVSLEAMRLCALRLEDVVVSKLCSYGEHALDFGPGVAIARALRERIDWVEVRRRTAGSPYAQAFLGLLEGLDVICAPQSIVGRPLVSVLGEDDDGHQALDTEPRRAS
jgi:hypothetical protein